MPGTKEGTVNPSMEFPISVQCTFINVYRGELDALPVFLTNCQNALDMATIAKKAS